METGRKSNQGKGLMGKNFQFGMDLRGKLEVSLMSDGSEHD